MKQGVFLGLLILVVSGGILSIVYTVMNPEGNIVKYIPGLATVVIAILTMGYVYILSGQLSVMGRQLEQMEVERRFQNQPLPYIDNMSVVVEKPRLYYSPPDDLFTAHSRYRAIVKVRNIGSHPAVCVDVSGRIEIPGKDGKHFLTTAINIPTLGEKEDYPIKKGDKVSFLFAIDSEGLVIDALREENPMKLPLINCRILFRNIMGGCFMTGCKYRLYMKKEEDDSVFSNWLAEMKSFWIKSKNEIDNMKRMKDSRDDKWHDEFEKLENSFSASVSGDDMDISAWPVPGSFKVQSIGEEEYEKELEDVGYGTKMIGSMRCILK